MCLFCTILEEDTQHQFISFLVARAIWKFISMYNVRFSNWRVDILFLMVVWTRECLLHIWGLPFNFSSIGITGQLVYKECLCI